MTRIWWKLLAFGVLVLTGITVLVVAPAPDVEQIRSWVATGGPWVPVWFVAGYAAASLLLVPRTLLSTAAGLAFGVAAGLAIVWVASMLGALAAFWLGRALGREGVARLAGHHLDRLDALVLRHGVFAVLLARLAPLVPFSVVNYGSGLSAVGFGPYALATAVGIVPGTVAYVMVGAAGARPDGLVLLVTATLFALTGLVGLFARRRARADD